MGIDKEMTKTVKTKHLRYQEVTLFEKAFAEYDMYNLGGDAFKQYLVDGHDTLANHPNRYKPAYGIDIGSTSYFNSTVDWIYYNSVKGVQLVGKSENIEM